MPVWLASAEDDLKRNIENYAEKDPLTAWRIYEQVIDRAAILDAQPGIGRAGRIKGTREFVLTGTPFILVYREHGKQVEIFRVLHGAQQCPPGKKDEKME